MKKKWVEHRAKRLAISCLGMVFVVLAALTGCGTPSSALTMEDAVGAWRAEAGQDTELVLHEGGTFEARDWPLAAGCGSQAIGDDASESGSFSGRWEKRGSSVASTLDLFPRGDKCPTYVVSGNFWLRDGVKYMCVLLNSDAVREDEKFFVMHLGRVEEIDPNACASYN